MTGPRLIGIVVPLMLAGCGGSVGGGGNNNNSCADVFATPVSYAGKETVVGCYYPGTYSIRASISQTKGTCDILFDWQATSGAAHQCTAKLSGDASSGYDVDYSQCSLPGAIHVSPDLSTFAGSFRWTVSCGSGTTTFENMGKQSQ